MAEIASKHQAKVCRWVNAKYPKLTRLAWNLLDKNKGESEQTEETSETKVGTRRNKKVDTNFNNKTRTRTDLAKSFRRRASDNEEITFGGTGETLADRKGKTWGHR